MNFHVRRIKPEEALEAKKIDSVAFQYPIDPEGYLKDLEKADQTPASRHDLFARNVLGSFNEGEELSAVLTVLEYPFRFDGRRELMYGIAGVASKPENRRGGGVRALFSHMLADAYEKGAAFSALYPFSVNYYRKYGYEVAAEMVDYTIPMKYLPSFPTHGKVKMLVPGDDLAPLAAVYDEYTKNMNFSIDREEIDWKGFSSRVNPYKGSNYVYLQTDDAGKPDAYLLFVKNDRNLYIDEFAYTSLAAARSLLGFLGRSLAHYYDKVQLSQPRHLPFSSIFHENDVERVLRYRAMYRAVSVKKALEHAAYKGDGALVLRVSDPVLAQNAGVWKVGYAGGAARSVEKADGAAPDLSLSVGTLTRCLSGAFDAAELVLSGEAEIFCAPEKLESAFYRKPAGIFNFF